MTSSNQAVPFRLLWMETVAIERVIFKNNYQQRSCKSFRLSKQMVKLLSSAKNVGTECSVVPERHLSREDDQYLYNLWSSAHLIAQALAICQDGFIGVLQQLDMGLFIPMNLFLAASLSRVWVLCKVCLAVSCVEYCTLRQSSSQSPSRDAAGKQLPPCLSSWLLSHHRARLWRTSLSFKSCCHASSTMTDNEATKYHGVSLAQSNLDLRSLSQVGEITHSLLEQGITQLKDSFAGNVDHAERLLNTASVSALQHPAESLGMPVAREAFPDVVNEGMVECDEAISVTHAEEDSVGSAMDILSNSQVETSEVGLIELSDEEKQAGKRIYMFGEENSQATVFIHQEDRDERANLPAAGEVGLSAAEEAGVCPVSSVENLITDSSQFVDSNMASPDLSQLVDRDVLTDSSQFDVRDVTSAYSSQLLNSDVSSLSSIISPAVEECLTRKQRRQAQFRMKRDRCWLTKELRLQKKKKLSSKKLVDDVSVMHTHEQDGVTSGSVEQNNTGAGTDVSGTQPGDQACKMKQKKKKRKRKQEVDKPGDEVVRRKSGKAAVIEPKVNCERTKQCEPVSVEAATNENVRYGDAGNSALGVSSAGKRKAGCDNVSADSRPKRKKKKKKQKATDLSDDIDRIFSILD